MDGISGEARLVGGPQPPSGPPIVDRTRGDRRTTLARWR